MGWRDVFDRNAVQVEWQWEAGHKPKDLPEWYRVALDKMPGALEPLRFRAGKLYSVAWVRKNPLHWPEAVETEVLPGHFLMDDGQGGIRHVPNNGQAEVVYSCVEAMP